MRLLPVSGALTLLAVLAACGSRDRGSRAAAGGGELAADTATMTRTGSGLRYHDVTLGQGAEATPGHQVKVHYTGWLLNGKKFDSSRDRGEPFEFALGAGQVIAGWDEGVAGMKVGGRRKLVIPPDLGYGAGGAPPDIPPGATLVFDVELLEVH
jgi:FKBP-type peptidyl-prolyl cis-trans isomerase